MDENKLQQQIVQLVQAAMQGNKRAQQKVQQIMQAAQQGDQQAVQIAQMIQSVAKQMQQQQVQAAKFGAKLNYIRQLNGKCPDGYEMQYFKQGGKVCKKCVAKQSQNPVDSFRCGRKMQNGGKQPNDSTTTKKRFIKTPTNSYDKLNKFGKSLVSGVGMTGIGVAGANVLKKKQKVSKNQQGGQIPSYVDYLQNFFKSFGNGSRKVINFLRKHAPIEYVVEPFFSQADRKGKPDTYMEEARKPTLGLNREVFHRYYPNGHFRADTTFRTPNGHYVSNKYEYEREDYNKAKDMWEGRDTIPLRK